MNRFSIIMIVCLPMQIYTSQSVDLMCKVNTGNLSQDLSKQDLFCVLHGLENISWLVPTEYEVSNFLGQNKGSITRQRVQEAIHDAHNYVDTLHRSVHTGSDKRFNQEQLWEFVQTYVDIRRMQLWLQHTK